MAKKFIVIYGTDNKEVKGTADTIEEAIFIRGPIEGEHFNNAIYKLIDVKVEESDNA